MNAPFQSSRFPGCWFCENIVDYPGHIALLYLGFPRCFILIREPDDFYFSTYEEFRNGIAKIQWLDPSEKHSDEEKEHVIETLWNFSIEEERAEEAFSPDL